MIISERTDSRRRREVEHLTERVADLCSTLVGEPRWPTSSSCAGRYWADIREVGGFRVLTEDVEDSESDARGFTTFTTRHIKVFADNMLLFHVYSKVQGLDEHDGGGYGDSRVNFVADGWHAVRVPWNDLPGQRALQLFSEQPELKHAGS